MPALGEKRRLERIPIHTSALLVVPDYYMFPCYIKDFSAFGVGLEMREQPPLDQAVTLLFEFLGIVVEEKVFVVWQAGKRLGANFIHPGKQLILLHKFLKEYTNEGAITCYK